jgi:hypothetical protein
MQPVRNSAIAPLGLMPNCGLLVNRITGAASFSHVAWNLFAPAIEKQ